SFGSGVGRSCTQPLLWRRPSQTVGSGRKMISSPLSDVRRPTSDVCRALGGRGGAGRFASTASEPAAAPAAAGRRTSDVGRRTSVPETHPPRTTRFQKLSAPLNAPPPGSLSVQAHTL